MNRLDREATEMADQEARHSTDGVRVLDPIGRNGRHSLELSGRRFDVAGAGETTGPQTLARPK